MRQRVVVTCLQMQQVLQEVAARVPIEGIEYVTPHLKGQQFRAGEMKHLLAEADYAIVGDDFVTEDSIAGSSLRGLIKWGIGYDSIDTEALLTRGIKFSNTPGQFAHDVAEQALALMLAVERGIVSVDKSVREGTWLKFRGRRLFGKSVLILGYGNLGRALAAKLVSLGLQVTVYDPYAPELPHLPVNLLRTFPDGNLFEYMISCLPLTEQTQEFVNRKTLCVLQRDGVFINVSRGKVVRQGDLVSLLNTGHIAGAGLDVYQDEPLPTDSPLVGMTQVVLGAHNSSNTHEGVLEASLAAGEILASWVAQDGGQHE